MPVLESNQPVNTPYQYRREAETSRARGVGALAFSAAAAGGIWWGAHRPMPEAFTKTFFQNPRMLGWGIQEATTTGLSSSLIYARKFGLGEWAGGVPKFRWGEFAMNFAKLAEEISPSQILRTFGVYEHLTALTTAKGITYRFTPDEALQMRKYLSSLTGKTLTERHMLGGVTLEKGSLYLERNLEGQRQKILEHAHLMMRRYVPRGTAGKEFWHMGKVAPAYEELVTGGRRVLPSARAGLDSRVQEVVSSFMIGGGQSRTQAAWRYWQATTRTWTQRFMTLMDDPFLSMVELFSGDIQQPTSAFQKVMRVGHQLWDKSRFRGRFGLGGVYKGGTMQMFGRWLMPEIMHEGPMISRVGQRFFRPGALLALVGAPFAYHAIDQLTATTGRGGGLTGAIAGAYEKGTLLRAHTLGRVFSPIARWQEKVAPGSTSPFAFLAFPTAGLLTGAFAGYAHRFVGSLTGEPTRVLEAARTPMRMGGILGKVFKGAYSRTGRFGRVGLAAGIALSLPTALGVASRILGGLKTPEELEDLYSGREEVPIMSSRWWIFGRTPFKGKKPEYYAPHWTVRARSRYKDEALFRGDESWLFKAIKKTPLLQDLFDPYYLEKLHYSDRPYPITGPSDLGIGVIDPLYKATLGRIFKPVRYMHTDEWQMADGEPVPWEPRPQLAPDPSLGGEGPYRPRDPYDNLAKQTLDYYSDAIGIVGWIGRLITRGAAGETTGYDVRPELESASQISSIKRAYWDASLGDPFGVTEAYRRLNPRKPRGQYYNVIRNKMPEWLPGEQYFINFRTGDPFAKIPRGEMRLPGPGYEALHPELRGISPEDYPEYHRFKILANVAPYSQEYKDYNARMSVLARQGELSKQEQEQVKVIRKQVRSIKTRKEFAEYTTERELDEANVGIIGRAMADYWDVVSRAETPIEQVMFPPIAPIAKFIHRRTALEDYEQSQVYGTDMSFWNRVYDNFIRPGIWRTAHVLGYDGVPAHLRRQRDIEAYFDKLEYIKNLRLEKAAIEAGDAESAQLYREKVKETMVGMNPYGNPLYILRAMPKRERDYWKAFREETDPEKQARILELVPDELKEVYRASYLQRAAKDVNRIGRKGFETEKDYRESVKFLDYVREDQFRQGQPYTAELGAEFTRAVRKGKAKPHRYADWYRQKELQEYFQTHQLPDESWIGWDPRVDMEDVKMKFVREEGYDFHDYDLWEDRLYAMTRKPYLNEATKQLDMDGLESPGNVEARIRDLLQSYDANAITVIPTLNGGRVDMTVNDRQTDRFRAAIRQARF